MLLTRSANHLRAGMGHAFIARRPLPHCSVHARRTALLPTGMQRSISFGRGPVHCHSVSTETTTETKSDEQAKEEEIINFEEIPDGLDFVAPDGAQRFWTNLKLAFALPWRRFKSESVLTIKLDGEISDQLGARFNPTTSVPQICECLRKAARDPRIVGIAIEIGPLAAGYGKVQEIRDHILHFRESGKFSIAFMKQAAEKEYYLASACQEVYIAPTAYFSLRGFATQGTFLRDALEKVGVEPQVKRLGKYKSAGDQLLRRDMSEPQREQLTAILEDIYEDFLCTVAEARGKTPEDVKAMLDEGIFEVEKFKEGGWIDDLIYEDQLEKSLKERTGGKPEELRKVGLKKYSKVNPSAFGLTGGKAIAIIRAAGAIIGGSGSATSSGSITAPSVIAKLRSVEKNKKIAAVVLRVDSPGGDALTSDLMWREIRRLAEKKPVVASMADVAASGGYYMSMGASAIVAEPLTITGSIGVVTGKFNVASLYDKIGYNKVVLSRGRYAEVMVDNRPFSEEESALFDASAQHAYESFRNKAAESRGMSQEELQEVAQGRVWSGKRALEVGLVDALGGVTKAVEIAKKKAGIPSDEPVTLLELSRARGSPLQLLGGGAMVGNLLLMVGQAMLGGSSPALALGMASSVMSSLGASSEMGAAVLMAALQPGAVKYLMLDVDPLTIGSTTAAWGQSSGSGEFLDYEE